MLVWPVVLLGPLTVACTESGPPEPQRIEVPVHFTMVTSPTTVRAVAAYEMDLPPEPRPWDTSDAALVTAVAAGDGNVTVALKAPESPRVLDAEGATGLRHAVSEADVVEGMLALEAMGVEFVYYFDTIGAVWLRIDPDLAPSIRALPRVDYVEPQQESELAH